MSTRIEVAAEPRRNPLNRERVIRAAVQLADREGIDALSMRRLAQELGVEAMSLYNHIDGKEDLLDGMADLIVGEIDPPSADGDWKAIARGRILSARRAMLRHPWASAVIVSRREPSSAMMAYMDTMAGIFRSGGFTVDLLHHGFHALGSRILGFSQELFDDSNDPTDAPEVRAVMLQQMSLAYPNITEIVRQVEHDDASVVGSGCDDQWEFEFALDLVLDGLAGLKDGHPAS